MSEIQYRIAQQNEQLFMLSTKRAGQRLISGLKHDAFPDPLPELSLRCPELITVTANHERSFLLALFLLI